MNWAYQTYRAPPCPGCGKEDAARMGSSTWGHDLSCCGEECGLKVRDALALMREDARFKFFTDMVWHAQDQLGALRREFLEDLLDDDKPVVPTEPQTPKLPCPVCGNEAIHAVDILQRTVIREPLAWDANENRQYAPVETRAKEIYDGFVYDGPEGTTKPAWTPGGNGLKQDEARFAARREIRAAGHSPEA